MYLVGSTKDTLIFVPRRPDLTPVTTHPFTIDPPPKLSMESLSARRSGANNRIPEAKPSDKSTPRGSSIDPVMNPVVRPNRNLMGRVIICRN